MVNDTHTRRRRLECKLNRTGARTALRKAVTLGSPRTGVIAHVHPETSILKQQTHQSGEPIWHAFTQFVKKTSVPDSVIFCC